MKYLSTLKRYPKIIIFLIAMFIIHHHIKANQFSTHLYIKINKNLTVIVTFLFVNSTFSFPI